MNENKAKQSSLEALWMNYVQTVLKNEENAGSLLLEDDLKNPKIVFYCGAVAGMRRILNEMENGTSLQDSCHLLMNEFLEEISPA